MKETKQGALPGTAAQARQLKAWLKENGEKPGAALPALQKAQEIYGYVPREVQQLIADALHKPLTEIYGVSTFYSQFNLEPKGRNRISVCLGAPRATSRAAGGSISCSRRSSGIGDRGLHRGRPLQPGCLPLPGLLRDGAGDDGERGRVRQPDRRRAGRHSGEI